MRRVIPSLLAVGSLALMSAAPLSAQDAPRFAYINSERIIAEAPGAQAVRQEFEQEMQQYQAELQTLEAEIDSLMQEYERRQSMLSQEARQQRQQEIVEKQQEYQQRYAQLQQQAAARQTELVEPLMEQINGVIEELREERGYTMIFDSAAGALISADPALDITEDVLDRLEAASNGDG